MHKDRSLEALGEILAVCLARLRGILKKKAAQGYVVPKKPKGRRITFGPLRSRISYNDRAVMERAKEMDQRTRENRDTPRTR
jgi:hypothetical protein